MRRREFVRANLAAGALTGAMRHGIGETTRERVPIGFFGATHSHAPDKIKLAMTSPDWEFVGVCDPTDVGRSVCRKLGARIIDESELLSKSVVVAVESEVRDHARQALLALGAGKHVHVEKPPASRLADLDSMIAAARAKRVFLQTGYMWRHHPGFLAIFEAVAQGWLGDPYMVNGLIGNSLAKERRPDWAEFGGGSMFELGSHLIDAVVRLLGKPSKVTPFLGHHGRFEDTLKDNNVAVFEYPRATALVVNTALQATSGPQRYFEVLGTNGLARLRPIEPPTLEIDLAQAAGPYAKGLQRVDLPNYHRYVADFAELAAAVRGQRPLSTSLDHERTVMETLLQASGMS